MALTLGGLEHTMPELALVFQDGVWLARTEVVPLSIITSSLGQEEEIQAAPDGLIVLCYTTHTLVMAAISIGREAALFQKY